MWPTKRKPAPRLPTPDPPVDLLSVIGPGLEAAKHRATVIQRIRSSGLSAAWKRALYGRWLVQAGQSINGRILNDVIGRGRRDN